MQSVSAATETGNTISNMESCEERQRPGIQNLGVFIGNWRRNIFSVHPWAAHGYKGRRRRSCGVRQAVYMM